MGHFSRPRWHLIATVRRMTRVLFAPHHLWRIDVRRLCACSRMKTNILALGLTVLLPGCAQTPTRHANAAPVPQERVSDRYSRKAVKSYEVFDPRIDNHVIMLAWLSTGEHFPMLCRKTADGIYPIPQSVFPASGTERWSIMCEPQVRRGASTAYALMALELSRVNGALFMGERRLNPSAKVPLLSAPSL